MNVSSRLPIFRSPEQERLLAELFLFIPHPISITELAKRTGTSVAGAHKEIERLEKAGLVTSAFAGRSRLVEADRTAPVYQDLRGLLAKTLGPEPLLRTALSELDGIAEAYIYGSWADPAAPAPGDIDVLVIGDPDIGRVYDAASAVEAEVGRSVNVVIRSRREWDEANGAFEKAVRSQPRVALV